MMVRYPGTIPVFAVAGHGLLQAIFDGKDFAGNCRVIAWLLSMSAMTEPDSWQAIHSLAGAIIACLLIFIRAKRQTFFDRTCPANRIP